jgi:tol-pal system protein YbgF
VPFLSLRFPAAVLAITVCGGCASRSQLDRVQRDQREVRALLADQNVAIEGLRRRLEILRQDAVEGKGKGGPTSTQAMQRLNELDARITALEQLRAIVPGEPGAAGTPMPDTVRPPEVGPTPRMMSPLEVAIAKEESALQGQKVEADYREAMNLVRQGQCPQAASRLRDFIRRNPKSELADNAQYWIGACYYQQREYNQAIKELSDVMLRYSKGDKAPAALLLLADAFNDSGDQIDAKLVLKKLISEHPRSEEAERAKQKLQALGD